MDRRDQKGAQAPATMCGKPDRNCVHASSNPRHAMAVIKRNSGPLNLTTNLTRSGRVAKSSWSKITKLRVGHIPKLSLPESSLPLITGPPWKIPDFIPSNMKGGAGKDTCRRTCQSRNQDIANEYPYVLKNDHGRRYRAFASLGTPAHRWRQILAHDGMALDWRTSFQLEAAMSGRFRLCVKSDD
ncbi:MAG: hypothetical protein JWO94_970 [Verrucomicrobiaceae bacterium]|nr:hypothetical protein [Verrucomicrobiaceae bacterium]